MRNYLTIAGVDSRDYGVYISGQGTFSAPEKAYTFYEIPGRNGAIVGNDHRLENIEVSYECFIYNNFSENIANFRSFLLSLDGYQKLTDSYHTDEYRYALYAGPFEPEVTAINDAGSFTLTFNCKPQRYLLSGDQTFYWAPSASMQIEGASIAVDTDLLESNSYFWYYNYHKKTTQYTTDAYGNTIKSYSLPYANYVEMVAVYAVNGKTVSDLVYRADISRYRFTGTAFDFYNGEFMETAMIIDLPTTGWTMLTIKSFAISLSDVIDYNNDEYFTDLSVEIDAITGIINDDYYGYSILGIEDGSITYDSTNSQVVFSFEKQGFPNLDQFQYFLSRINTIHLDVYATFDSSLVIDPLDWTEPDVDFFTIKDPFNPKGATFAVTYTSDEISNPTIFASSPLVRAYGTGSFTMDGVTITVSDCTEYVDIDCDLMDCYEGSTNRNEDVAFSTYDFPKLQPGDNDIEIVSGITKLELTPRWWRL